MSREGVKKLIMAITVTYPNFHPKDMTFMVNVWTAMLSEYDGRDVEVAFKRYALTNTSGFAPSVGQIVQEIQNVREDDDPGELAVWSMVSKAIRNSGYHAQEEFDKLPPLVQRVVHSPQNLEEWAMMDTDTVNSVIQSNVIRSYRAAAKSEKEEARLPEGFRKELEARRTTRSDLLPQNQPELIKEAPDGQEEQREWNSEREEMIDALKQRLSMGGGVR